MRNLLEIQNIQKKYGNYIALNDVSFHVPKGVFGLLESQRSWKNLLNRIINQITITDRGSVILDGEELQPKHVAYGYFERHGLCKGMKVGEQCII